MFIRYKTPCNLELIIDKDQVKFIGIVENFNDTTLKTDYALLVSSDVRESGLCIESGTYEECKAVQERLIQKLKISKEIVDL